MLYTGARENVDKIIFLLTDGVQYPKKEKGQIFNPVLSSENLIKRGIKIIAVGIGSGVSRADLEKITRNADHVVKAESVSKLTSDEFVRSVAKQVCKVSKLFRT